MTRLLDLPDEIQLVVIGFVDPDDLVSFSQSSRKVLDLSRDVVARHRRLQKAVGELRLDRSHHPLNVITALQEQPELALYVRSLTYHGRSVDDHTGNVHYQARTQDAQYGDVGWQDALDADLPDGRLEFHGHDQLVPAIDWPRDLDKFIPDLSPQLGRGGHLVYWERWLASLQRGSPSAHLLLLMMHLPRLKRLRMSGCDMCDDTHMYILRAWQQYHYEVVLPSTESESAENATPSTRCDAYTHISSPPSLEILEAFHNSTDTGSFDLGHLLAFTHLPTLHTIRGKNITSLSSSTAPASTNLTTLELTDSTLSPPILSALLPSTPHLHTLRISFSPSPSDPHWSSLPSLLLTLAATHASKIQHLTLLHPYSYGSTPPLPPLRPFIRLKTLEISLASLLPHASWRDKESHLLSGGRVPCLAHVLPPSVVELTIGVEIAPGALSDTGLLRGWPKRQLFPLGLEGEGEVLDASVQRWGWEVMGSGGEGGSPFGGRVGLGFGGAGRVRGGGGGGGGGGSSGAVRARVQTSAGHDLSASSPGGVPMRATSSEALYVVNPLLMRLRRIRYFCCPTQVVKCDCVEADTLCEYEEGRYMGLEITRKVMRGWGGEFEDVWDGDSGGEESD
ncbi:hypothetical protein CAC42_809 [Sphaceloma murrayae]|uniref:F-box domain-containing protein n=1 Tax=Sphaceloma murrayae TaxID=2082308 RepID=A0A2K1QL01_9PEZI|nr:hypothetical protein CAC42_809 [Sphaceloma murrayae]